MAQSELNVDTTPEWVVFGWTTGARGSIRVAMREGETEPDVTRMQELRVVVTATYRQTFYGGSKWDKNNKGEDDWPEPKLTKRDESTISRRTFT